VGSGCISKFDTIRGKADGASNRDDEGGGGRAGGGVEAEASKGFSERSEGLGIVGERGGLFGDVLNKFAHERV